MLGIELSSTGGTVWAANNKPISPALSNDLYNKQIDKYQQTLINVSWEIMYLEMYTENKMSSSQEEISYMYVLVSFRLMTQNAAG